MSNPNKTDYECRKHFEASLDGLANIAGRFVTQKMMRSAFKTHIQKEGIIKKSTTELNAKTLDLLGEAIGTYVHRYNNTPPDERGYIDFDSIMNIFWDQRVTSNE